MEEADTGTAMRPPEHLVDTPWTWDGGDSAAGRELQQERIALFARVTAGLSLGFFLVANLVNSFGQHFSPLDWINAGGNPYHLATIAVLGVTWLLCRRGRLSPWAPFCTDAASLFVIGAGYALMGLRSVESRPETAILTPYAVILAATATLTARAVTIPSTARRTFWVGVATSVPVLLGTARMVAAGARMPEVSAGVHVAFQVAWMLLAVILSTIASRVIFGLRQEAREARQLGQYTLVEKLSEGGMGEVYRARHALMRRPVAIKLLRAEKAGERSLLRFEREVQLTSRLTHPSTIAIFDYGRTGAGVFYYVMEYLDGWSLDELVRQDGPQPPGRVIHLLAQACGALIEAHGVGLIHRDIKPANLMLCERGAQCDVVKVVDFGLVKDLGRGTDLEVSMVATITGTPLYLSPEAIRTPEEVDARSDLYSLGAVAYYLLTGEHVFAGRSLLEICGHHLHSQPMAPSLRLGRPLPDDLEQLVLACLAKEPAARPADARSLRDALLGCKESGRWGEEQARSWWQAHRPSGGGRAAEAAAPGALSTSTVTGLPTVEAALSRRP